MRRQLDSRQARSRVHFSLRHRYSAGPSRGPRRLPANTKVASAVRRVGAERVMYGSDASLHDPGYEIRKVQASGGDESVLDDLFYRTARKLFLGVRDPLGVRPASEASA